ncbi:MAG: hypothetical protein NTZ68_03110 [Candidatus Dependentiae bacterium]|nr:hypothetical protein [Candidatus Dependentiae bacterium]
MKKIIVSLVAIFSCGSVQAINIKLLKGTHTIAPENYSPVMGVSFLECGIAEQWYKLSARSQAAQLKEVLEKNPKALIDNPELTKFTQNMPKNSATEDLIMLMFHIAGGSFGVTNADDNPVKYLEPMHIGKILQVVQKWEQASANSEKMAALKVQAISKKSEYDIKITSLQKEMSQLNTKILAAKKTGNDSLVASLQNELGLKNADRVKYQALSKKLVSHESIDFVEQSLQQELNDLCMSFKFERKNKKLFTEGDWNSFAKPLIGSIKESTDNQRLYAENTTQGILLGFMLKKSNTRNDLQSYFRGLLKDEAFVLPLTKEYSSAEINKILAEKTDTSNFEKLADLLSAYTSKKLYESVLPSITGYQFVNYKGIEYSDCMDTVIRVLVNIVTYQPNENKLGVTPSGLRLNKEAQEFYKSEDGLCENPAEVGNIKVHEAWANVASNIPGCVYKQIGTGPENVMSTPPEGFDGFMPVDYTFTQKAPGKIEIDGTSYDSYPVTVGVKTYTLVQKKVGNATYLLVPKNSELFCCEMRTNLLNIVIALSKILDLGLYSKFDEIYEPDFALNKFKQLCEKLNWEPLVEITKLDQTGEMIIPINVGQSKFSLNLDYNRHAKITDIIEKTYNVNLEVSPATSQSRVAAIVGVGLKKIAVLPDDLQAACLYKNVAALSINQRIEVVDEMLKDKNSLKDVEKNYVKCLIMSFSLVDHLSYLPIIVDYFGEDLKKVGLGDFIVSALNLHDATHKSDLLLLSLSNLIKYELITGDQILPLLPVIEKGLSSSSSSVQSAAISAVTSLIGAKLVTVDQVLPLLAKGLSGTDLSTQSTAMSEVTSLIEAKLVTVDQVLPLLENGMSSARLNVQNEAISGINDLIKSNLVAVDQVLPLLKILEKGLDSTDSDIEYKAISGINDLIKSNLVTVDQVLPLLAKGLSSLNFNVENRAISGINDLIKSNLVTVDQALPLLDILEKGLGRTPTIEQKAISGINGLIKFKLVTADQVFSLVKARWSHVNKNSQELFLKTVESLVEAEMITKLEIQSLIVGAKDNKIGKKLAELKAKATSFNS